MTVQKVAADSVVFRLVRGRDAVLEDRISMKCMEINLPKLYVLDSVHELSSEGVIGDSGKI